MKFFQTKKLNNFFSELIFTITQNSFQKLEQKILLKKISSLSTDKPIIDRSPLISKSASDNGSTGRLICRAQGAPNVTFTWSREGSVLPLNSQSGDKSSKKYTIEATNQLDLVTYQSVLIITGVTTADYGSYECVARNELGFDAITIQLNRTSKPDPPLALRVINITTVSVTLRWIPGFDGGLGQEFRVRYKPTSSDDPSYSYKDVFPPNSTFTVISGLNDNTEYIFSIMSSNEKGHSDYTADIVKATTLKGLLNFFDILFFIMNLKIC